MSVDLSTFGYVQLAVANDTTSPLRCVDSSVCSTPLFTCSLPGPRHGHSSLLLTYGDADILLIFGGETTDLRAKFPALAADLHSVYFEVGTATWVRHRLGYRDVNEFVYECNYPLAATATGKCPVQRRDAAVVVMANSGGQNGRLLVFGGMTYCSEVETCSSSSPMLSFLEKSIHSPPTALNDLWFLDLTPLDSGCLIYGNCRSILLWTLISVPGQQPAGRWGAGIVLDTVSSILYITGGTTTISGASGEVSYSNLNDMFLYQLLDPLLGSCSASGNGLSVAYAGVQTSFLITCKDVFGNAAVGAIFRVEISGPIGITPVASATAVDGTYRCVYEAVTAGVYSLEIRTGRGGSVYQDLIAPPYKIVVHPSETSPLDSTASGDFLSISTAGIVGNFMIVALDALQNRRPGGDSISALMVLNNFQSSPGTGAVTDKMDGSYDVAYVFTRAGLYQMQLTIGDNLAAGSPFLLTVYPGDTHISHTYAYGYIDAAAAGEYSTIYVQTRDLYGNFAVVDISLFPDGVEDIAFMLCKKVASSKNQTSGLPCKGLLSVYFAFHSWELRCPVRR